MLAAVLTAAIALLVAQAADAGNVRIAADFGGASGDAAWFAAADAGEYRCPDCSVILVSIDTLRADRLGSYGYNLPTSPSVDKFAEDGVVFRTAVAAAPTTLKSHASMFTSTFTGQHHASIEPAIPLPDEAITLAELLGAAGYETAAFTGASQMAAVHGLGQGFDIYNDVDERRRFARTVDDGLAWLDAAEREKFFLFLHTYEVHTPYVPEQRFLQRFASVDSPLPDGVTVDIIQSLNENFFGRTGFRSVDAAHVGRLYDAGIASMDEAFGALLSGLRARGLYDSVLIVFTSDHGEALGERGALGRHSHTLHDEVLRVPLIVKFPRGSFAGVTVNNQVRLIDVAPTITDVIDVGAPPSFVGTPLVPGRAGGRRRERVSLSGRETAEPLRRSAVRTTRWKLFNETLYDLALDPQETADVSIRHPGVRDAMNRHMARLQALPGLAEPDAIVPDDELVRQLEALGYLGASPGPPADGQTASAPGRAREDRGLRFPSRGWHAVEVAADGRRYHWMERSAAAFFENPRRAATLVLEAASPVGLLGRGQRVEVHVNGEEVLRRRVTSDENFIEEIPIPSELLGEGDLVQVDIAVNRFVVPTEVDPDSRDPRSLGLQVFLLDFVGEGG